MSHDSTQGLINPCMQTNPISHFSFFLISEKSATKLSLISLSHEQAKQQQPKLPTFS
jgi:hypothetical protein